MCVHDENDSTSFAQNSISPDMHLDTPGLNKRARFHWFLSSKPSNFFAAASNVAQSYVPLTSGVQGQRERGEEIQKRRADTYTHRIFTMQSKRHIKRKRSVPHLMPRRRQQQTSRPTHIRPQLCQAKTGFLVAQYRPGAKIPNPIQ